MRDCDSGDGVPGSDGKGVVAHELPFIAHQPEDVPLLLVHQMPPAFRHWVIEDSVFEHSDAVATWRPSGQVVPFVGQEVPFCTIEPSGQETYSTGGFISGVGVGVTVPLLFGHSVSVFAVVTPSGQAIMPGAGERVQGSPLQYPVVSDG